MRGFHQATILSPGFHGLHKERLAQWPPPPPPHLYIKYDEKPRGFFQKNWVGVTSCYGTYTVTGNIKKVISPNDEEVASSKKHTQFKTRVHASAQTIPHFILGDPGAVSRVGKSGRKSPLGTDSHRTISKNWSGCRLLIGHKKCFVLLGPIGEQFLCQWVLFVSSYTTAIGHDPFNQNSDRSDREKRTTSKGGPVFSKLFWLDRTDPLSFGPKFPEILVEWISPIVSPHLPGSFTKLVRARCKENFYFLLS